jgi:hypothetical protein
MRNAKSPKSRFARSVRHLEFRILRFESGAQNLTPDACHLALVTWHLTPDTCHLCYHGADVR